MTEREKYPSELAERFQLRLPLGLRDRIRAHAERNGHSMNTEIVRVLEQQFAQTEDIQQRVVELLKAADLVRGGQSFVPLSQGLLRILMDAANGRLIIDQKTQQRVDEALQAWVDARDESQSGRKRR